VDSGAHARGLGVERLEKKMLVARIGVSRPVSLFFPAHQKE